MDALIKNINLQYWSRSAFVAAGVTLCVLLAFGEYFCHIEAAREKGVAQNRTLVAAAAVRRELEADLSSTLYLGIGLSAYLSLNPSLKPAIVDPLLKTILSHGKFVRNIGLAPNNRLDYIYPRKGNEPAIGVQYKNLPTQWPAVKRAIDTRETVVVGPIELTQGGVGIVTRTPVFLQDDSYWGIISIVVDLDALLENRRDKSEKQFDTEWAMRAQTDRFDTPPYVFGDPALFNDASAIHTFEIPGATWEIAVAPDKRWAYDARRISFLRDVSALLSTLIAALVFLAVNERGEIQHLALHDSLTGLANRRLLLERVDQCIALADRNKSGFCILFLDLNKFKPVNDQYGHKAGDFVLREVANRLKLALRKTDTVARVGGDEFVILLPETNARKDAQIVAKNMVAEVARPMSHDTHEISIGVSVGIGRYPENGTSAHTLIEHSDQAMYQAKTDSR